MAEGRMLKKRVSYSKKLASLSSDSCRLLYTWLIPHCDIEGRIEADPLYLKSIVFPRIKSWTPAKIDKCLKELHEAGLIYLYEINGDRYLEVVKFKKYQNLRPDKEAESSIPAPPEQLPSYSRSSPAKVKLSKVKISKDNNNIYIATPKAVATFYTQIKNYFISAYKKKFNSEPAIDFGKDGRVVKKAEGLFKNIEDAYRLIDDFLESKKAEECGYTLSVCFSTHTINLWKAGKLLNLSEDELFEKFSKKKQ